MQLKKTISLLPAFAFLFIIIFGLIKVYNEERANSLEEISNVQKNTQLMNLINGMTQLMVKRSQKFNALVESDDPFMQDDLYLEINKLSTKYTVLREKLVASNLVFYQHYLLTTQATITREINNLEERVIDLIREDKLDEARRLYYAEINSKRFSNFINHFDIASYNEVQSSKLFLKSRKETDQSFRAIAITGLLSLLTTFFLGFIAFLYQQKNTKIQRSLANTDGLTKLPNRANFIAHLKDSIENNAKKHAIVFLDLDYFKSINDNYGHAIGDAVLKEFVRVIKDNISHNDFLSRFGGDEFVLLMDHIQSDDDLERRLKRLSSSLDTNFKIQGHQIYMTSSIGVSLYPRDGEENKELLKNADLAMYQAKASGRNCYRIYSKKLEDTIEKEKQISHALHTMVNNNNQKNELYLQYQPFHDCKDQNIHECEALIRWKNEKTGALIPPDYFISIAEQSSLIKEISFYVIEEVCRFQMRRQNEGLQDMRINVNLSGNKKCFVDVLDYFDTQIINHKMNYSLFGIELTERAVMDASPKAINKLTALKEKGMKISLDDFGSGYSSLSIIKKLPITTIKIDKSFIAGLPDDKDDQQIVNTIIGLAHSLNLEVIAEGVETEDQYQYLINNKCDVIQGFYFNHPLYEYEFSADDYSKTLKAS